MTPTRGVAPVVGTVAAGPPPPHRRGEPGSSGAEQTPPLGRDTEPGYVSVWVITWALLVLGISGFGLDLWRGVGVRRALMEQAEAAAAAGANGIDTDVFRTTGEVVVDPAQADLLVRQTLAAQGETGLVDTVSVIVDPVTQEVTVELTGRIEFTLLRYFPEGRNDGGGTEVGVRATAAPRIGEPGP